MTDTSMNGMFEPAQVQDAIDYEIDGAEIPVDPEADRVPEPDEDLER